MRAVKRSLGAVSPILLTLLLAGCSTERPVPRMPAEIPTRLPSQEEARRVRPGSPDANGRTTPAATPAEAPAQTPAATPGATPAATPGATRGATPAATPGAQGSPTQIPANASRVTVPQPTAGDSPSAHPAHDGAPQYAVLGYRVQLLATSSESVAHAYAARIDRLLSERVYVVSEGSLHKVQIGDCLSQDEARHLRRRAIESGEDDAFIISAQVQPPPGGDPQDDPQQPPDDRR